MHDAAELHLLGRALNVLVFFTQATVDSNLRQTQRPIKAFVKVYMKGEPRGIVVLCFLGKVRSGHYLEVCAGPGKVSSREVFTLPPISGIMRRNLTYSGPSKKPIYLQQVETDVAGVSLMHRVQPCKKKVQGLQAGM